MSRPALEHRLRRIWQGRGVAARALWPLAALHAGLLAIRHALYRVRLLRSTRLPVPVIVVGNLVAGGAGKTPTTLALVQHLQQCGWRPGIISRGHGRRSDAVLDVHAAADPRDVGDEPLLLHRRSGVPVVVGRRRAEAGQALLAAHPDVDVLVCDDGLQHLALARDLEICVFDARGIGNGWLLPAGPLRESWPRPADLLLWTEAPAAGLRPQAGPPAEHVATRRLAEHGLRADGSRVPLAELHGQPLVALAAIARPEAFFCMLARAGLDLQQCLGLPDHDPLDPPPASLPPNLALLCTEKDAHKLWRHRPDAIAVPLLLDVPASFWQALDRRLQALGPAAAQAD